MRPDPVLTSLANPAHRGNGLLGWIHWDPTGSVIFALVLIIVFFIVYSGGNDFHHQQRQGHVQARIPQPFPSKLT
jgi:hypothetical protein